MQEKEVFRFEKSGNNSKGFWVFVTLGFIALFFGGFSSIAGLVMMGYGVHLLTKKNKIIVYPTGFSILDENNSRNIAFERVLGIKGELNQKMRIIYLKKPFYEYNEQELEDISNNFSKFSRSIIFDDELLEKDFARVFNVIKEQFKNYVFEKYDNDLEKIIISPYLFKQINDNKLIFTKSTFGSRTIYETIKLEYKDKVKITTNKKNFIAIGKLDNMQHNLSFEPQWKFLSSFEQCDTTNLINAVLVQEILTKKYKIRFIKK